ncbi:MAG: HAD family hydrolase [Deltaproteobacteria bacterium]
MLRAIIFDFDGTIADAEPVHFRAFQAALAEEGFPFFESEYVERYLALDDRGFFSAFYSDRGQNLDKAALRAMMSRKSGYFDKFIRENIAIFHGVADFIRAASRKYTLAIGSGALSGEIEFILRHAGLLDEFPIIVSADDVVHCKPHPETFIKALSRINETRSPHIPARQCLVVEDSIHGIAAARAAGMKCLAVANSYPAERLSSADLVVGSLAEAKFEDLERLFP